MVKDIEKLCYALILLQECALGYNNQWYRERCGTALSSSTTAAELKTKEIIDWKFGSTPTADMIKKVEAILIEYGTSTASSQTAEQLGVR